MTTPEKDRLYPVSSEEKATINRLLRQAEAKYEIEDVTDFLRGIRDAGNWTVPAEPGYGASDLSIQERAGSHKRRRTMKDIITYAGAVRMLPDDDSIHTFVQAGSMLIGADWRRESILKLLAGTSEIYLSGPMATEMHHGLVVMQEDGSPLFIETKEAEGEGQ